MKIKYFCIALALVLSAAAAHAQKNAIKIQPLHLILGKQSIQYERMYAPQSSFTVELQRWGMEKETNSGSTFPAGTRTVTQMNIKGHSIEIMNRSYFEKGFQGLYFEAGPHFSRYSFYKHETISTKEPNLGEWWHFNFILGETRVEVVESKDTNNQIFGMKGGLGYHLRYDYVSLDFAAGSRMQSVGGKQLSGDPIKSVSLYLRAGIGLAF